ncbi:VIT and VWA domain-containing protein [Microbulbifer sp. TYP-18]|uniref:VIT and VWA domain-containing protein n=1 Tax=Microbulbifer sp. TYP-18 TaxID=3230024 RepID=UPI0034C64318
MTTAAAVLEPVGEARVALESVDVQSSLRGLYSEVLVAQAYRNLENINVEAVYTFPLPLDAVLLDLVLELNGKTLRGVVQPKAEAEGSYEDAIDEGDSAILLQQLEPGVFTLNVGNILPNEHAVVRFRYAQLHRWQGKNLRFHLPTTIAPRYGEPAASGMAPHQIPEYALSTDHGFSLVVQIHGALAKADFDCPTHPVAVSNSDGAREVSLSGGSALMDRDFVLVMEEPAEAEIEGFYAPDDKEYVALASFHPQIPEDVPESPRCVKLVVDCSGSMSGDSIAQAKAALREIISLLKPNDYFNLITFGSTFNLLFPEPVIANEDNIRLAAQFVEQIDATMGGTEIGAALTAAYRCGKIEGLPANLLLITDGEVWNHEQIVKDAQKSGHRIFSVGVGSAVSEAFVRRIAETTSGACELVSPRENMSVRIVRHFRRIGQARAESVRIEWPTDTSRQFPGEVETVYTGDTLHVFGWFPEIPVGKVRLVMAFGDGCTFTQEVTIATERTKNEILLTDLPRVAANARLTTLEAREATELAGRYKLVTEHTSCVLVFAREEDQKSGEVPALCKVPQVLAAGWGGMGSVKHCAMDLDEPFMRKRKSAMRVDFKQMELCDMDLDCLDTPHFLRQETSMNVHPLVASLNARYPDTNAGTLDIATIAELMVLGLDHKAAEALSDRIGTRLSERDIVVAYLAIFARSDSGKGLSRHVKRLIRMADRARVSDRVLIDRD